MTLGPLESFVPKQTPPFEVSDPKSRVPLSVSFDRVFQPMTPRAKKPEEEEEIDLEKIFLRMLFGRAPIR